MGYTYAALEAAYAADKHGALKWANKALEAQMIWRGPRHAYTEKMEMMVGGVEGLGEWNWTAKVQNAPVMQLGEDDVEIITVSKA